MRIALAILAICLTNTLWSQNLLWSTPQKITNRTYFTNILGQNKAGIFYFQTSKNDRNRNVLITSLRHDMKLKNREEFLSSKDQSMEKLLLFNDWISLIYSVKDKKAGTIKLYSRVLDGNLETFGNDKLLFTKRTNDMRSDFFKVIANRNRNGALITIAGSSDSLYNNLKLIAIDDMGNAVKQEYLKVPFAGDFELKRHNFIENKYFCVINTERKEGLFKKYNLKILLEKDLSTGETKLHELFDDAYLTNKGFFNYDAISSSFNFNSFYYNLDDTTKPIGFYQYKVYTQADSAKQRLLAFHPVFMNEIFGRARNNNDVRSLYMMKHVNRTDGGDIFICERKEIDEQQLDDVSIYGVQQTYTRYYFYFYEISILSVNPDGSLDWHKVIKKEQISLNDEGYYSSFGCEVTNDRMYFVYNDLSRKTSNVMIYEVNPHGQGEGDIFIKGSELDGYAIPKESIQVSNSEILVPVIKLREGFSILKIRS
ncbi:MAG: hypothetical protein JXQ87_19295 [Bacteroidia bacterium]